MSPRESAQLPQVLVPVQLAVEPHRRNPAAIDTADSTSKSYDWSIWASVAVVLVILIVQTLIVFYEGATANSFVIGYALGASMAPILFGGLPGFLVGRSAKNKQPNIGFAIGTTIAFALQILGSYGGLHNRYEQKQQAETALSAIKQDVNRAFATPAGTATAIAPPVSGDMGELQKFMHSVIEDFQGIQRDYAQELHGIGWQAVLDPNRIQEDIGLRRSREMVTRARQIMKKYAQQTDLALQGAERKIRALRVSDDVRNATLTGFQDSIAKNNRSAEVWGLETEILDKVDAIFSLLASSRKWRVEDGQVRFENEQDLTRFNEAIASINRARKQEMALRKDAQAEINTKLDSTARDVAQ